MISIALIHLNVLKRSVYHFPHPFSLQNIMRTKYHISFFYLDKKYLMLP